jgi:hypothetical protein
VERFTNAQPLPSEKGTEREGANEAVLNVYVALPDGYTTSVWKYGISKCGSWIADI